MFQGQKCEIGNDTHEITFLIYVWSFSVSSVFLTNRRRFREKSPYRHFYTQFEDKVSVLLVCDTVYCHRPDTSPTPLRKPSNTRNRKIIQTSNLNTNFVRRSKGFWECTHTHTHTHTHQWFEQFVIFFLRINYSTRATFFVTEPQATMFWHAAHWLATLFVPKMTSKPAFLRRKLWTDNNLSLQSDTIYGDNLEFNCRTVVIMKLHSAN